MKILFVAPPRKYWPYINEYDNFMLPLWMACLAPIAEKLGFDLKCIDCMAEHIGWKSLERIMTEENPDIVAISESHMMFMPEQIKLINIIKNNIPNALIFAGGGHYSNQAKEVLEKHPVDVIVVGEGELTLEELLLKFKENNNFFSPELLRGIHGIAYRYNDKIVVTESRNLVENLDDLPIPGWHLLPMDKYGSSEYLFSPASMCISHSRGCVCACDFCCWWTNMAERKTINDAIKLKPRWRSKSPERTVREVEILVNKYNKRYFVFVDATWNADADWNKKFAQLIIEKNIKVEWMSFMRSDFILRDAQTDILELCVRAGLRHILIGIEHSCPDILKKDYNKINQKVDDGLRAVRIMRQKYPDVFIQGTFILGGENESEESIRHLHEYIKEINLDFTSIHILTPMPGTVIFNKLVAQGLIDPFDYEQFDLNTAIMSTKHLSKEELQYEAHLLGSKIFTFGWALKLIFSKNRYRRNMGLWGVLVSLKIFLSSMKSFLLFREQMFGMIRPKWYDS